MVLRRKRCQFYLSDDEIRRYCDDYQGLAEYCIEKGDSDTYLATQSPTTTMRWMNFFTGNVSVDRDVLIEAGCFDENMKYWGHEDMDLGIRLYLKRARFGYSDEAANYHMMHDSNFDVMKKESKGNMPYLMKKYKTHITVMPWLMALFVKQRVFGFHVSKSQSERYKQINAQKQA